MLRDRLFLTGLGIGLIVGAILLQLMNVALDAREAVRQTNGLDDNNTLQQSLGVSPSSDASAPAQHNGADAIHSPSPAPSQTPSQGEHVMQASESPGISASPETAPDAGGSEQQQEEGSILVSIYAGMSSEEVAEQLARAGVVSDQQALLEAIYVQNVQTKLRVGTYSIPEGADYSEIITIITQQKQ